MSKFLDPITTIKWPLVKRTASDWTIYDIEAQMPVPVAKKPVVRAAKRRAKRKLHVSTNRAHKFVETRLPLSDIELVPTGLFILLVADYLGTGGNLFGMPLLTGYTFYAMGLLAAFVLAAGAYYSRRGLRTRINVLWLGLFLLVQVFRLLYQFQI